MIKHFTTPEFADLLKQYGIEIATPFGIDKHLDILAIGYEGNCISLIDKSGYSSYEKYTKPAYLLSEVLTWLPDTVIIKGIDCTLEVIDAQIGKFRYNGRTYSESVQRGWLPIEQLITQGITEGWLTKEIIEQQIKDKQ